VNYIVIAYYIVVGRNSNVVPDNRMKTNFTKCQTTHMNSLHDEKDKDVNDSF